MRVTKSSTTAHLYPTKPLNRALDNKLESVFHQLKGLLQPYQSDLQLKRDIENHYELWTSHGFRTQSVNPKTKIGLQFAAVIKCKRFVGLYLYPLYISQNIKDGLCDSLKSSLGGQTCFHITELTDETLNEIDITIKKCWDFYKNKNWVKIKD